MLPQVLRSLFTTRRSFNGAIPYLADILNNITGQLIFPVNGTSDARRLI